MSKPKDGNFSDLQTMGGSQKPEAAGKTEEDCAIHTTYKIFKSLEGACIELSGFKDDAMQIYELEHQGEDSSFMLATSVPDLRRRIVDMFCCKINVVKKDDRLAASERALAKLASGKTAAS